MKCLRVDFSIKKLCTSAVDIQACAGKKDEIFFSPYLTEEQAVTKWETEQSAPSTENLFKLAEIFGTTVDILLASEEQEKNSPAEQIYYLYKMEEAKKADELRAKRKKNLMMALSVIGGYLIIYLLARIIWCNFAESNFIGWLVSVRPNGEHSYLYGWLLSSKLFWFALAISTLPAIWGVIYLLSIIAGILLERFEKKAVV